MNQEEVSVKSRVEEEFCGPWRKKYLVGNFQSFKSSG